MKILKKRVLFNNNYYDHIFILQFNNNLLQLDNVFYIKNEKLRYIFTCMR